MLDAATAQDGWKVETRERQAGKTKGSVYRVYISPQNVQFYSMKKAKDAGFSGEIPPKTSHTEAKPSGSKGAGNKNPATKKK